jgi:hypothetical protein
MTKVEAIEHEVEKLTSEELAAFSDWFAEYAWQAWDKELEDDIAAGKLDKFATEPWRTQRRSDERDLSHRAGSRFWRLFDALPPEIQQIASENFALLRSDPRH